MSTLTWSASNVPGFVGTTTATTSRPRSPSPTPTTRLDCTDGCRSRTDPRPPWVRRWSGGLDQFGGPADIEDPRFRRRDEHLTPVWNQPSASNTSPRFALVEAEHDPGSSDPESPSLPAGTGSPVSSTTRTSVVLKPPRSR